MSQGDSSAVSVPMFIDGQVFEAASVIEVFNPARPTELVGKAGRGAPEDIGRAISAAHRVQPEWASKTHRERLDILKAAMKAVDGVAGSLVELYVRENGKVRAEAERELTTLAPRMAMILDSAAVLDDDRSVPSDSGSTYVINRPYGVVVSIVPWNSPLSLGFSQIISAMVTGNTVVIKPPETCPIAMCTLVAALAEKLPAGVLNLVTGLPAEIGDALISNPLVSKIAFTGSVASARKIMCSAANNIADLTLELGGNDAAIVLPDADLSEASMKKIISATFTLAGQVCMAIKRLYVHRDIADKFIEALQGAMTNYYAGNGLDPNASMGPLHTRAALLRTQELLDEAKALRATIIPCGGVTDEAAASGGHFFQPTLVVGVPDSARVVQEEQFCPILPILIYDDIEDAIARANSSMFGLGGSVWSQNVEAAAKIARRIEAGTVFVNVHGTGAINRRAPYGGLKHSGIGRKAGLEGLMEFVELQTLTIAG